LARGKQKNIGSQPNRIFYQAADAGALLGFYRQGVILCQTLFGKLFINIIFCQYFGDGIGLKLGACMLSLFHLFNRQRSFIQLG
jgi:hypothetical protein